MEQFTYESYCGLYCGACDILMAYRNGLEQNAPPHWDELPSCITQNIPSAPIVCHGCKTDSVFAGCQKCPIRKCARKQEGLNTCLDCRKYPCMLHNIAKFVKWVRKLEQKLPHLKIIPQNLATIEQKGMQAWLEKQRHVWECPDCQTAFSWYQTTCGKCGKDVEALKDYHQAS